MCRALRRKTQPPIRAPVGAVEGWSSMLWRDPNQRHRLVDIRDNLLDRIAEAEHEDWLGEVEGLRVSLAGAQSKLAQIDQRTQQATPVTLGLTRTKAQQT